jgi:hypothetical protein
MAKIRYKTISTNTISEIETAEKLLGEGWVIGSVGLFTIQFYKKEVAKD